MATLAEPQQHKPWSMARVVTASSAGTAFEWYDFFIFGSLTPVIAKVFLAGLDPTSALIAALALFAVGFAFARWARSSSGRWATASAARQPSLPPSA
jgi:VIT1/CCC1 family predicted Fe2+/Mn2+ transporter